MLWTRQQGYCFSAAYTGELGVVALGPEGPLGASLKAALSLTH